MSKLKTYTKYLKESLEEGRSDAAKKFGEVLRKYTTSKEGKELSTPELDLITYVANEIILLAKLDFADLFQFLYKIWHYTDFKKIMKDSEIFDELTELYNKSMVIRGE